MENVAHSLAGLLIADAVVTFRTASGAKVGRDFPRVALVVSALANNLPDADLLYASGHGKLGYLMHHRGHTHTLPIATAMGVLLALAAIMFARKRSFDLVARDRVWILFLGVFGTCVHMALDSLNVYGVHPFWPFTGQWFYGDAVFIAEPLFWFVAIPSLLIGAMRRLWRRSLWALLGCAVALIFLVPQMVLLPAQMLSVATLVFFALVLRRMSDVHRSSIALAGFAGVIALFVGSGFVARRKISADHANAFPDLTLHDLALSPLPANPWCWSGIAVATSSTDELVLYRVATSLAPSWIDSARCMPPISAPTVPLGTAIAHGSVHYFESFRAPLADWRSLVRERCDVEAFARFARAPFWRTENSAQRLVGDMRFDFSSASDFAEFELPRVPENCSEAWAAPWIPPRAELSER